MRIKRVEPKNKSPKFGGVASTREGALGDDLGARDAAERERDASSGVVDDPCYKFTTAPDPVSGSSVLLRCDES